jgi:hypothetical protein
LLKRSVVQGFKYATSGKPKTGTATARRHATQSGASRGSREGFEFEDSIALVLESAGATVIRQPERVGAEGAVKPDVLFWLPGTDPDLFNPVVVEAKAGPMTPARVSDAREQLMQFMQSSGVRTGLLILKEPLPQPAPEFQGLPLLNVFAIDFETFQELVATGRLAEHLRQARNRAAHGLR